MSVYHSTIECVSLSKNKVKKNPIYYYKLFINYLKLTLTKDQEFFDNYQKRLKEIIDAEKLFLSKQGSSGSSKPFYIY